MQDSAAVEERAGAPASLAAPARNEPMTSPMTLSKPKVARPRAPPLGDTLGEVLAGAGVDKTSTIHVTGPGGLAALLWLCRHGYEQVGLVRHGRSPGEDSDLLWAPLTCDLAALDALLETGPHPRDGGVLIVQTPEPPAGTTDPVHTLLRRHGYRIERCLHGRHRELHVARRASIGRLQRAA
jgi:hypothetical protein